MRFAETKKFDQRETFLEIRGAVFFFFIERKAYAPSFVGQDMNMMFIALSMSMKSHERRIV